MKSTADYGVSQSLELLSMIIMQLQLAAEIVPRQTTLYKNLMVLYLLGEF